MAKRWQSENNFELFKEVDSRSIPEGTKDFLIELKYFDRFGKLTQCQLLDRLSRHPVPVYINEFWSSKQRAANRMHEISYRACFKPQLPRFFMDRLSDPGALVYDPFMGRGTALLEGVLAGRHVAGCDINPLSSILLRPRLNPPSLDDIRFRLDALDLSQGSVDWPELKAFYHEDTLAELTALRAYLIERKKQGEEDFVDEWIRMVATNRLTGHSKGFFSVYTLPPNQAVSLERQMRINEKRGQIPDYRDVKELIWKKSKRMLQALESDVFEAFEAFGQKAVLLTKSCDHTPELASDSIDLVVTSPPFLDVVDYKGDNWLRCWFNDIDPDSIPLWVLRNPEKWQQKMLGVFKELSRILKPQGYVCFEVGEIRNGSLHMEELVIPIAEKAGLSPLAVVINDQNFTKTSQCWGIENQTRGTNTNRIVLMQKL